MLSRSIEDMACVELTSVFFPFFGFFRLSLMSIGVRISSERGSREDGMSRKSIKCYYVGTKGTVGLIWSISSFDACLELCLEGSIVVGPVTSFLFELAPIPLSPSGCSRDLAMLLSWYASFRALNCVRDVLLSESCSIEAGPSTSLLLKATTWVRFSAFVLGSIIYRRSSPFSCIDSLTGLFLMARAYLLDATFSA